MALPKLLKRPLVLRIDAMEAGNHLYWLNIFSALAVIVLVLLQHGKVPIEVLHLVLAYQRARCIRCSRFGLTFKPRNCFGCDHFLCNAWPWVGLQPIKKAV